MEDSDIIRREIDKHQALYDRHHEAWGYTNSQSSKRTFNRHEVIANALESSLTSSKARKDLNDRINAGLKALRDNKLEMTEKAYSAVYNELMGAFGNADATSKAQRRDFI